MKRASPGQSPSPERKKQREFIRRTLVQEICDILQKYPEDSQIFKELIQNAEDAGASEMVFIYDESSNLSTNNLSNEKLKEFQGPSLYAYNNGYFEGKDWDGIVSLGISNKVKDPLKVGRFGLGFKSIFHMTDLPCIFSRHEFAYLDPLQLAHENEVVGLDFKSDADDLSILQQKDEFQSFRELPSDMGIDVSSGYCNGTLFRFPLRTKTSKISNLLWNGEKMTKMVETYQKEGCMNLLFLKNIKTIKFIIMDSGKRHEIYNAHITANNIDKFHQDRTNFINCVRENTNDQNFKPISFNHEVEISESLNGDVSTRSFVISELFGYDGEDEFLNKLTSDPDLSYTPLISVALPETQDDGGHIFCCLPLPLREKRMTGMPAHVNGYFALGQDRKDLKWRNITDKECTDKSILWNESLIGKLLPKVYYNLMKYLVTNNKTSDVVYAAWPNQKEINSKWNFLKSFVERMQETECVFVTYKNEWIYVKDALFLQRDIFNSEEEFLATTEYFKKMKENVVLAPDHILLSLDDNAKRICKETVQKQLKSCNSVKMFQSLTAKQQSYILDWIICNNEDISSLVDVPIIRTMNGQYISISNKTVERFYLTSDDRLSQLLPDTKNVVDNSFYQKDNSFMEVLHNFAIEGKVNLLSITDSDAVLFVVKQKADNLGTEHVWNESSLSWLTYFWTYQRQELVPIEELNDMLLIPVTKDEGIQLNRIQEKSLLMKKLEVNGNPAILNDDMDSFLHSCGVRFVEESYLDKETCHLLTSNNILLKYDYNGILAAIDIAVEQQSLECIQSIIDQSSSSLRKALVICMKHSRKLTKSICDLNVFETIIPTCFSSINIAKSMPEQYVPKVWKEHLQPIIVEEYLGAEIKEKSSPTSWSFEEMINHFLSNRNYFDQYEIDEMFTMVLQYLSSYESSDNFIDDVKSNIKIKLSSSTARIGVSSQSPSYMKPKDLFQSNVQRIEQIFYGEEDKLLPTEYSPYITGLKILGLRCSPKDISEKELINSIKFIANLDQKVGDKIGTKLEAKIKAVLEVAKEMGYKLNEAYDVPWIPVALNKPRQYPESLSWYATATNKCFAKPTDVFTSKFSRLIGSVSYTLHSSLDDSLFTDIFEEKQPTTESLCQHLTNISRTFNPDEKRLYSEMLDVLYSNLSNYEVNDVESALKSVDCDIWIGDQFVRRERMLKSSLTISNLEPYFYTIPTNISIHEVLKRLTAGQNELDVYLTVLQIMMSDYDKKQEQNSRDIELAVKILDFVTTLEIIDETVKDRICVPLDSNFVKFCKIKECFYRDFDDEHDAFSGISDEKKILHKFVGKDIAVKLGIPDLVSEVLSGGEDLFESWGQNEPLTLRLNRLLKDYEDGLAIPKELIQNADDAGASEISFLYDKRSNKDKRGNLISPGMKEWQGPALWIFNDAMFTEDDFCNITKLNAGTKENDTNKIGKFGLGFNGVYHLTDVPSFISGKSMVIFDPHTDNLGRAIKDKTKPGLRIPLLSKNGKNLKLFNDQFMVFDRIFGAHLNFCNDDVLPFDGTLFRLPLRNQTTASRSKIKELAYNEKEMNFLLQKLEESLEYLLLFTQNIRKISCYHLEDNARDPGDMRLMFNAEKTYRKEVNIQLLKCSSEILKKCREMKGKFKIPDGRFVEFLSINCEKGGSGNQTSWLVSSCVGSQETYEFARIRQGYNPCGGVAVQLDEQNKLFSNSQQNGFMFCFLPLPEKSNLPVHVNGAFEVSNDRKQLSRHSSDEKSFDREKQFNHLLAKDLGKAYINLLHTLKEEYQSISLSEWFKILPSDIIPKEKEVSVRLMKSLFETMLRSDEKLFPSNNTWHKWKDIMVISDEVQRRIGVDARSYLNWFYKKEMISLICLDIPDSFLTLLRKFDYEKDIKEVPFDQFCNDFFKRLKDDELNASLRNKILHSLLQMNLYAFTNENLKRLLSENECIPTQPNGKLVCPKYLVKTKSNVAKLFDVTDETFMCVEFEKHSMILEQLGMNTQTLSWELILDRAQTIEKQIPSMKKRSCDLMSLILATNANVPDNIQRCLLQTRFVLVKQKPDGSIFDKWASNDVVFTSPSTLFKEEFCDVVCTNGLVCEKELDYKIINLFEMQNRVPSDEQVKKQIDILSAMLERKPFDRNWIITTITLSNIYSFIQKYKLSHLPFINSIKSSKLIYTEDERLMEASSVYYDVTMEVPGYIHKLPYAIKSHYGDLMNALGVKSTPSREDYINVLKQIFTTWKDRALNDELLNSILHSIIPHLVKDSANLNPDVTLFLPDSKNCMKSVSDLNFKDVFFLPEIPNVNYINEDISPVQCLALGVKPLGDKYFQEQSIGMAFGQHEKLCTRIKSLLEGYSQVEDVLKEILQNANDAGATEVNFILDTRKHSTEKIFSKEWKPLQGPALLVINNGKFTQSDLKGIQSLGEGSKNTDSLKTGKYGVGFNAVYHLTDCPSLLTTIDDETDERKDVLCIFDPNLMYANGATKESPGRMIPQAKKMLREIYSDIGEAFLLDEIDVTDKTMFRLPLRSGEMAKTSNIWNKPTTVANMESYIKRLKDLSSKILLFLNNVKSLSFKIIRKDKDIKSEGELFTLKEYGIDNEMSNIKEFKDFQREFSKSLNFNKWKSVKTISKYVCLQHYRKNSLFNCSHFHIVEQVGFSNIEEDEESGFDENQLCMVPKGGVAILTDNNSCDLCKSDKKLMKYGAVNIDRRGVFCTLPLPDEANLSPLPVLINGHFALDFQTRRCLSTDRYSVNRTWNICILKGCVLSCYLHILTTLAKQMEKVDKKDLPWTIGRYYERFPVATDKHETGNYRSHTDFKSYWDHFTDAFYKAIVAQRSALLLVHNERENQILQCTTKEFLVYDKYTISFTKRSKDESKKPPLLKALQSAHISTDMIPELVYVSFERVNMPLTDVTPIIIRELLVQKNGYILDDLDTPCNIKKHTRFKNEQDLLALLAYCLKKKTDEAIKLEGLPLCLLADGTATIYSEQKKVFFTQFDELIPTQQHLFLNKKAFKKFFPHQDYESYTCFNLFTLDRFSSLVHFMLSKDKYENKEAPIVLDNKEVPERWLYDVWRYIALQIQKSNPDLSQIGSKLCLIGSWSLLPSIRGNGTYLLPVSHHKTVLNLIDVIRDGAENVKSILRNKCMVFEYPLEHEIPPGRKHEEILKQNVYGSFDVVENVLSALEYSHRYVGFDILNMADRECLLTFIYQAGSNNLNNLSHKLCDLPLFHRYNDFISNASGNIIVLPSLNIPTAGLDIVEQVHSSKILKCNIMLGHIYEQIGFHLPDVFDFYRVYILNTLPNMNDEMVYTHINFIKDIIMRSVESESLENLINELKSTNFIPINSNRYMAKDLYYPGLEIFKLMIDASKFPPHEYLLNGWYEFLVKIGLQNTLNENLFVQFATSLEKYDMKEEKTLRVSQILCDTLFNDVDEEFKTKSKDFEYFLSQISSIKFIVPNRMNGKYEKISKSVNADMISRNEMMCFKSSVKGSDLDLVWTSLPVLPKYASPPTLSIDDQLYVKRMKNDNSLNKELSFEDVMKHIKKITSSPILTKLTTTCQEIPSEYRDDYEKVLKTIYKYLNGCESDEDLLMLFKEINLIMVDNKTKLEVPQRSILSGDKIIVPYLNSVDVNFGEYFEFLERIGCAPTPTSSHYVTVLGEINISFNKEKSNPNEYQSIVKAVMYLAESLKISKLDDDATLYLPTRTFQSKEVELVLSNETIYVNDYCLEGRLKNFDERILLHKYEDNDDDKTNDNLMKYLPQNLKPKLLTAEMHEELVGGNVVAVGSDHISQQIKTKIKAPEFIAAITRLIKHDQKLNDKSINIDTLLVDIVHALQLVEVCVYETIQTQFSYKNQIIDGSIKTKPLFVTLENKKLIMCFTLSIQKPSEVYSMAAQGLISVFEQAITSPNCVLQIPRILEWESHEITERLDENGILKDSSSSNFLNSTNLPLPGDPVPLELYALLSNDFTEINDGEYVALEEITDDGDVVYMYVIVCKSDDIATDRFMQKYKVKIDESNTTKIESYKLYRFRRFKSSSESNALNNNELVATDDICEDEDDLRSYEEIIKEIRKLLQSVTGDERKRIARRLYLRWHPDKNSFTDKVLATKVFQFIQNELERLESQYRSYFNQWDGQAKREREAYETYTRSYRQQGSFTGFHVPPTFHGKNPQPEESRRWFRQANYDLQSAEKLDSNEWICFLAHQAVEKALKASNYLHHYERNDSHNLLTISAGLNSNLSNLGGQMESIARSSAHLRYPNCWSMPGIPHTQYSNQDAQRALEIAREVIQCVRSQVENL